MNNETLEEIPSGNKLCLVPNVALTVDVYSVLEAFNVTCPARQHAIKKLLCTGLRGKGDSIQDLTETIVAVKRALSLELERSQSHELVHDDILR